LTTYTFHAILQFVSHQLPGRDIQVLSQAIRGCIPDGSGERLNGIQEVEGSIPFVSTKKMPTLDTIGRNADGIGLFRGFSPSNFTGETKDPNGVFTEAGWIRTPKFYRNPQRPF
jgi:hypothetical protein